MRYVVWSVIFLTQLSGVSFADCRLLFEKLSSQEIAASHQSILTDLKEGDIVAATKQLETQNP